MEDVYVQQTSSPGPPFPTRFAFVVQFGAETAVGHGQFMGRVEHIVSGDMAHFHTLDELWAFMSRVLATLDVAPEESP
jgi:hypothetical protein